MEHGAWDPIKANIDYQRQYNQETFKGGQLIRTDEKISLKEYSNT